MFDPNQYGGLIVEVPANTHVIPVTLTSMADSGAQLFAYPQRQEDGTWLVVFPQVPAGNWRVTMSYTHVGGLREGQSFDHSAVITVFPGGIVAKTVFIER